MKKILLIGNSPLPTDNASTRPAAGLRTYQFIKALENAKISFEIATIAMDKKCEKYNKSHLIIDKSDIKIDKKLQTKVDKTKPDIIIAVNTYPSYLACKLQTTAAIWTDLNGWIMAEAQAQAFKSKSNSFLNHYHNIEKTIITRTDKISTVSDMQNHTILGELATYGRLNRETFGYNFVETIENATTWFKEEKKQFVLDTKSSDKIDKSKFNLLWLGGYNTWADTETLFAGLETAMKAQEDIYYISTGGQIAGLDDTSFNRFLQKIEKSKLKDRFIFLGWIKTEEIPSIYRKATVGLNIDKMCYETTTGARNRINEMMKFGLPVLTTAGSEIAGALDIAEAGVKIKSGDSKELAKAILEIYADWEKGGEKLAKYGENGEKYTKKIGNYNTTCKILIDWIKDSMRAPDADVKVSLNKKFTLTSVGKYLKDNGVKKTLRKILQKIGV